MKRTLPPGLPQDLRVLVVDDHRDTLVMLETLLGSLGWRVETSAFGDDALRKIAEDVPDLLLSDIGLPDMTGYELVRRVRELPTARIAAVAVTGSSETDDVEQALEAGFDAYVTKPMTLAALFDALRRVLDEA